jgi:penicillin-insensitive murein endopeptidase
MRLSIAAALLLVTLPALAAPPTPWSRARTPLAGPARAIGGYSAGCIAGAVALPVRGDGFRVVKPERNRVFGHPLLVSLIRSLGAQLVAHQQAPLYVGDMGQPRGGPAPSGHASHQTGLDVDLWFAPPSALKDASMVDAAHRQASPRFTADVAHVVELAAANRDVERIFLNPLLKQALCARTTGDRRWLQKVRPWWGHDDHFHVRLACPADSPECVPQAPLPPGDGCDALGWWLNPAPAVAADRAKGKQTYAAKVGAQPLLPLSCAALIEDVVAPPVTTGAPAP